MREGLRNTRDSRRSTSLTAVATAITFYTTRWSHLRYGCCEEFQQPLCSDTTMIIDMITGIICLPTGRAQDSGAAIADHAAALNGKYTYSTPNVLKWLAGTIRDYHCQLSQSAPDWTTESDRCEEREPSAPTLFYFVKQSQRKRINRQRANMDVPIRWHTKRVFRITVEMFICSRDSQDPRGYRMDRLGTLRRPADSACI